MKIKEEIKNIFNKLSLLLSLFQQVLNLNTFGSMSKQIQNAAIGDNKIFYLINRSLKQVIENDLYEVTTIGDYAFYSCEELENVTISDKIVSIGTSAFGNCTQLNDIYLKSITPPTLDNLNSIPTTTTIHVPVGSGEAYKTATNWSYHATRIVEDPEL